MSLWKRARRPEQKAERREAILGAANELLEERGFEGASMRAIACRAGLSKANLYRYFRSKEELFLGLYAEDLLAWIRSLTTALRGPGARQELGWVAGQITASVLQHPRMASMSPLLAPVMERNLPREVLISFKRQIHQQIQPLAVALSSALPGLGLERAKTFFMLAHAMMAGLWPLTHPAPELETILAREEFAQMRPDFHRDLGRATRALLMGLLAEADEAAEPAEA